MIIGDKNVFAFQYEVESEHPIVMVKNCLWIQGIFLGNYEDSGTISAVLRRLLALIKREGNFYEDEFVGKSPEEIMLIMIPNFYNPEKKFGDFTDEEQDSLMKYDKYIYGFGENYDNFVIRIYAIDGVYHFLWQLRPHAWQEVEVKCYQGYSRDLQHATVALTDLEKVFNEIKKRFPDK
jgi:hypothetical protein